VRHRAAASGVDLDDAGELSVLVGRLVVAGLPALVAEVLRCEPADATPPPGLPSGAVVTFPPKSVVPSLPDDLARGPFGAAT
jgi:hypothetical protein